MLQQKTTHCISVQLQVKSHPRVMSGHTNAESSLSFILGNAAVSRARCKCEGDLPLCRGSHQVCSALSREADKAGVTTDKNTKCTQPGKKSKSWNPNNSWLSLPSLSFFHGLTETFIYLQGVWSILRTIVSVHFRNTRNYWNTMLGLFWFPLDCHIQMSVQSMTS